MIRQFFLKLIATIFLAGIFTCFAVAIWEIMVTWEIIVEELALGKWWFILIYPFKVVSVFFFWPIFFFLFFILFFLLFYYKEEKLLLKIVIIVFLVWILGGGLGGIMLANRYNRVRNNLEEQSVLLTEQAFKAKDPKICEKIKQIAEKEIKKHKALSHFLGNQSHQKYNVCVIKIVLNLNEPALCNEFLGPGPLAQTRCLTHLALKRKEIKICNYQETVWQKDECLVAVANRIGNPKLCDLLINSSPVNCQRTFQQIKIALERRDPKECERDPFSIIRICVSELAFKMNNPQLCNLLEVDTWKEDCLLQIE